MGTLKHSPYRVVEMFEETVADYAGSNYAVAVDSCTDALFLCCCYLGIRGKLVTIPAKTYLSVPQVIIHAGGKVQFEEREWRGVYSLYPYDIWDGAKRFRRGMYESGFHCLSFHIKKHVPIGKGGMILTNREDARDWFRKARYEGRSAVPYPEDNLRSLGWNMYMTPEQAARGLMLMQNLPDDNPDLEEDYRDLREFSVWEDQC